MSGTVPSAVPIDFTQLIVAIQGNGQVLTQILAALKAGVAITNDAPARTVATLPTGSVGQFFWASNARKAGEGAGVGTGLMVYWNPSTSQWFTFSGNVLVTS